MRSIMIKMLPVVAAGVLVSPLALSGTATAAPAHAGCGVIPTDWDPSGNRTDRANGVNMRSGSDTSCASRGQANMSHALNYHCWTLGNDGHTWTYARNLTTGFAGWMRDDLLEDSGSDVWCKF